jgi:copper resistance protein D
MDEPVSVTSLLLLARGLYLGSGMVLVNATVFRWLILAPVLATEPGGAGPISFRQRLRGTFLVSAALLFVAAILWFWATAADMGGTSLGEALDYGAWSPVLFQTRFGLVCEMRLGLFALLAALAWNFCRMLGSQTRSTPALEGFTSLVAAALLASVAWTGHAGAAGGAAFPWTLIADSLHLLAGTVWPAGLLFFSWILSSCLTREAPTAAPLVIAIARRFSAVSLIAVIVLALTGTVEACFIVRSFGALVTTLYGRVLCLKLATFVAMLALAAWNRFRLLPRLTLGNDETKSTRPTIILRQLRRFVRIEWALAAGIIAIVALLGTLAPPR